MNPRDKQDLWKRLTNILEQNPEGVGVNQLHEQTKDLLSKNTLLAEIESYARSGLIKWEKGRRGQKSSIVSTDALRFLDGYRSDLKALVDCCEVILDKLGKAAENGAFPNPDGRGLNEEDLLSEATYSLGLLNKFTLTNAIPLATKYPKHSKTILSDGLASAYSEVSERLAVLLKRNLGHDRSYSNLIIREAHLTRLGAPGQRWEKHLSSQERKQLSEANERLYRVMKPSA